MENLTTLHMKAWNSFASIPIFIPKQPTRNQRDWN
jgi:hypothetical protein